MNDATGSRMPHPDPAESDVPSRANRGASGFLDWLKRRLRPRSGAETLRTTIEEYIDHEDATTLAHPDELVLLRNILNFRELTAEDVMVPRADIVAVDIETTLPELAKIMSENAHSRLPVYRGLLDDAIGMVHIKDVLAASGKGEPVKLSSIVRRTLFVAPSMPVLELLLQMRASRIHMAMVVDEYGGIDGLLTIEDLVEEIVGDIEDEHDEAPPEMIKRPDGTYDVDARVELADFEDRVGSFLTAEERDEDIDTLGGLVFSLTGRIPGRGEVIRHTSGIEFEVLDADPRRIKRLRVAMVPATAPKK